MTNNEQLEQLKSETHLLISKISHEIRNPVALIQSTLDLMAVRHPEITQFDEWDDIMDSMDYLKGLLNDVSEFNNAARLHLQPTHMKEFLTATFRSLQPTLDYLFIRLVPELTLPETPLLIDPTKFRQALLNLLRNAYEASPIHGIIHFYAFSKDSSLILQIEDNGCGIPPEDLSTLFQPFVTHKKEGTGLGLTITKQIIEAHNGTITVESSPGRGTKFTITLPMTS